MKATELHHESQTLPFIAHSDDTNRIRRVMV